MGALTISVNDADRATPGQDLEVEKNRQQSLRRLSEVGREIVDQLFGGDLERWRARPSGTIPLLSTDKRRRFPGGRSAVYRAVRVYDLCKRYPELLVSSTITASHVAVVLRLAPSLQIELLRQADRESWTVQHLKAAAEGHASQAPTGRPQTPRVLRTLRTLSRVRGAFEGMDALLALDRSTATHLLNVCREAREDLDRAERSLARAAAGHSRLRVLLVDRDRVFSLRAQRQLRSQASMIRIAGSASEALSVSSGSISCAIINLFLPDGCGLDLSERLRERQPGVRCLFLTTVGRSDLPARLQQAEPLIPKTSGLSALKVALVKVLASPQ
jgi:CheY-like chemotaxis protein